MDIKKLAVLEKNNEQILVKEGETFSFRKSDDKDVIFNVLLIVEDGKTVIGTPYIEKSGVEIEFVGEKNVKSITRRYRNKSRYRKNRNHTDVFYEYKVTQIAILQGIEKKDKVEKEPVKKKIAKKITKKTI